jgi:hypothetical protein
MEDPNNATRIFEQTDEEILTYTVSDEDSLPLFGGKFNHGPCIADSHRLA